MRFKLFFTLACVIIIFASAYTQITHAQSIEDGLGGHWTFDKSDTDAKIAKDALGENDGKINSRDTRSHVVVAVGHDRNAFIKPLYFEGEIDDVAVYHRALDKKEVQENYQIAFDVKPAGKLAVTWGAIKAR